MTALLALVIFAAGAAVGALVTLSLYGYDRYTSDPELSRYTYLRTGYHDGHHDGALGIWRGGPLR